MTELPGMRGLAFAVGAPGGPNNGSGPAPEAAPVPTIFSAIQRLGLKLEARKGTVEHLVVDAADKTPVEN
jgi:uncharacterized protein (TIGR03435 family)